MFFKSGKPIVIMLIIVSIVVQFNDICSAGGKTIYDPTEETGILSSESVENFTDDFLNKNMKKNFVPGVVVSIVKDGKVILNKGYGYEDVSEKTLMNPENSLVHIGSVGKLFTQTAAMKLVESKKIKLGEDINIYFGDQIIKAPNKNKVTIENLLTHTDGFEESSFVGSASKSYKGKISYEEFIKSHIPKVIEEPGSIMHYTNIGTDILGFIVQKVSGMAFADYITKNIFVPVGMKSSCVSPNAMPRGYVFRNGKYEECQSTYFNSPGSGDVVTTSSDISKFMLAHLGYESSNNFLSPETLNNMHRQHFTNNLKMPGMAYGFYEAQQNGIRIIKHDGAAVQGFMSTLFLIPDKGIGAFISSNSLGSEDKVNSITFDYQSEFIEYFYPEQKKEGLKPTEYKEYFKKITGTYRNYDNVSKVRLSKLAALFPPGLDCSIEIDSDKNLVLKGYDITGKQIQTKLCEIEPYLFKRLDNGTYVSFKINEEGEAQYLFRDEPFDSYERISFFESQPFNLCTLGFCIIFFIIIVIAVLIMLIKNIRKGSLRNSVRKNPIWIVAGTVSFLNLSGIIGVLLSSIIYYWDFQFYMPIAMVVFLTELLLGAVLTLILIIITTFQIKKGKINKWNTVAVIGVSAASIVFIGFELQWNLLGFNW